MICSGLFKYAALFSDLLRVNSFTFVDFLIFSFILFCAALFSPILLITFITLLYYIVLSYILYFPHDILMFYFILVYFILLFYVYFISIMDRVMFQAAIHQILPTENLFSLRPILVGFVVYKLALGQAWLRVLYTHIFIYQRHYIISTLREPLNKKLQNRNGHSFCRTFSY